MLNEVYTYNSHSHASSLLYMFVSLQLNNTSLVQIQRKPICYEYINRYVHFELHEHERSTSNVKIFIVLLTMCTHQLYIFIINLSHRRSINSTAQQLHSKTPWHYHKCLQYIPTTDKYEQNAKKYKEYINNSIKYFNRKM